MMHIFAVVEAAFSIPPLLLAAICAIESNHRSVINKDDYGSPSYGVCQLKLATARGVDFTGTRKELMDPGVNIYYAGALLDDLLKRYKNNVTFAISAYNMGRVKYSGGKLKNIKYVRKVKTKWGKFKRTTNYWTKRAVRRETLGDKRVGKPQAPKEQRAVVVQSTKALSRRARDRMPLGHNL